MTVQIPVDRNRLNSNLLIVFLHLFNYVQFGAGDPLRTSRLVDDPVNPKVVTPVLGLSVVKWFRNA